MEARSSLLTLLQGRVLWQPGGAGGFTRGAGGMAVSHVLAHIVLEPSWASSTLVYAFSTVEVVVLSGYFIPPQRWLHFCDGRRHLLSSKVSA